MWKDEMGYQQTKDALEKSLKRLGTDYLDIYLIHWPRPSADCENWKELDLETWRAMEELQKEGKIRGLGLSNFLPHHIKNILENGTVKPVVNQLELHPGYMQQAAVQYCKEHGIQMQAWSPIGRRRILEDGLILELAGKYQVSPAQLCLRFLLQNDIIPLPKSSSMERMKQNMDLFHFEISEEDVSRLATMPQAGWSGEYPDPELAQKNVV
jgi:diketogulonate reductase-like aldo/keto reductase